jgi:PAS domain S-box-containing protein
VIRTALQSQYDTSALTPANVKRARADQFCIIAKQYRTAPLLMPLVAITLWWTFDSPYPSYIVTIWTCAVIASYFTMAVFQERCLRKTENLETPERTIKAYAVLYWIINTVWVSLVPIFWTADNPTQILMVFMILVAHLVTVTAIGFRITRIYFSNSVPLITMILFSTLVSGDPLFTVLGPICTAFYLFLTLVAHSAQAQSIESFVIRFRNEELIKDLAKAIDASDATRATAEQANLNLREREELFRALVENAYDTIMLTDSDGYVRYAAPSVKQFGLSAETALGKPINVLLPSINDDNQLYDAINQKDEHGQVKELQEQVLTQDGRTAWIDASVTDLRGSTSVGGLVLNIRDVTERKRADDEMHRHLEVLDALATGATLDAILTKIALSVDRTNAGAHAAIFLIDENRQVIKATGPHVPDELHDVLLGTTLSPLVGCCGAAIESGNRVLITDVSTDPLANLFAPTLAKVGFKSSWAQPIFSRGGRTLGVLTSFHRDHRTPTDSEIAFVNGTAHLAGIAIDRRQQENQLREASERAEMANRAKSRFLATMSHELRTPLNAIIGFSEVMQQEMFGALGNDRYKEYSTDILTSGRHLLSMIDDILDLSKIEAGRYDLEERDIDINEVIDWSSELMRPKLAEGGLKLAMDLTDGIPLVNADRRAMRQILLNLLSNAVKFTQPGGTITIGAHLDSSKGLTLSVTDTGIGIPAERVAETLEPFVQIESAMTGKHHGTGLGLSITKHLVEMHNGTFDLTSEENIGTCVSFTLPTHRLVNRLAAPSTPEEIA